MKKKKEMRQLDTPDGQDDWSEFWKWWNSDRPEARVKLELKPEPCRQSSFLPGLKTLLRKRLMRLLGPLEHEPKISH